MLYNALERNDQKDLLHEVVERVVVNSEGVILLELRTPFAYLDALTNEIRSRTYGKGKALQMKTGGSGSTTLSGGRFLREKSGV